MSSLYSAATGLKAFQKKLDVISNNIANVSTTGYKTMDTSFSDLLYSNRTRGEDKIDIRGNGVKAEKTTIDFTPGAQKFTSRQLDFAIQNDGFFKVSDEEGNLLYTRDGSFMTSMSDGVSYLTTSDGKYVLNEADQKIIVQTLQDGSQIFKSFSDKTLVDSKIGVFKFNNNSGLNIIGGNKFEATISSGTPTLISSPNLIQGYLETSTVDIAKQMLDMIETQRGFQMSSRIVKVADEIEDVVNNLR